MSYTYKKVSCSFLLLQSILLYKYIKICLSILILRAVSLYPVWVIKDIFIQAFYWKLLLFLLSMCLSVLVGHRDGCVQCCLKLSLFLTMSWYHFTIVPSIHSLHTHTNILDFVFWEYVAMTHGGSFNLHFSHV